MGDSVDAVLEVVVFADVAEPRHARVDFDVGLQRAAATQRLGAVFLGLRLARYRLRDVEADQAVDLLNRGCDPG